MVDMDSYDYFELFGLVFGLLRWLVAVLFVIVRVGLFVDVG